MAIDRDKVPVLYSVSCRLAYKIANEFYKGVHYVWCAPEFNSSMQPHTSNPKDICSKYLRAIKAREGYADTHDPYIDDKKAGILRGADAKKNAKVINDKQYKAIRRMISDSRYEDFFPVIYIIPLAVFPDIENRCIEVPREDCASESSTEYKISDLASNEFTLIDMRDVLFGLFEIQDKMVKVIK